MGGGGVAGDALNLAWAFAAMRVFLAMVFLIAGLLKLADPPAFADGIASFQFLPFGWINFTAMGMPVLEIVVGMLLFSSRYRRQGCLLAVGLSVGFLAFYLWALAHGIEVNCGCFGAWEFLSATTMSGMVRAAALLAVSLIVCQRQIQMERSDTNGQCVR